ncbi:lysostaphin resistance A-like protein [Saccharicrinis sp. FJH54]|uniref:CPBP family intramembrane glutamic endopeptidase n=1 Tax=Saccharicrinis sp. FJH54 TaxID=3344665 RepID=UPI0035D501C2
MFLDQVKKGQTSVSAYIPSFVLIVIAFIAGQFLSGILLTVVAAAKGGINMDALSTMDFEAMGISSNLGFFILMLGFLPAFFGLFFARGFHKRPFKTFITSRPKPDFRRIGFAMLIWGLILAGSTVIDYIMDPENYIVTFEPASFLWLLLIALVFFPFQIGFEEIFFRGYLYQMFGNLFRYPVISWIVTSVLFGLMHSGNPEIHEYGFWVMMPGYILLGAFLGLITILDDGLEMALGIHFINNFFLGVGVNYAGSAIKVNSAFQVLTIDPSYQWVGILISGAIFTVVAWFVYKFDGFRKFIQPLKLKDDADLDMHGIL